jgi:hypothetical protein
VSCCGLAIYIKKSILRRQKKKNYENSNIISQCQNIIFKKNPVKETKILQDIYYNSIITNLKFQQKPKYHSLSKNPDIKIDLFIIIIIIVFQKIPLSYYYSIMNPNTTALPW